MWRQPTAMRRLPWSRRLRLLFGAEPWSEGETAALEAYVNWLSGPTLLLHPALIGLGFFLGGLVSRQPLHALGAGAGAFVTTLGLTLFARQQAHKHVTERPERLSVQQVVMAGLAMLAVLVVLALGTTWMTHRVTVLVTDDDLLRVVGDVDEQWWGRVDTIVVPDAEQIPAALEREAPDILLLLGGSEPVAAGVGPGSVVAHREDDPAAVVTLHLTNGDAPTVDLMQELLAWPGPGPDAFRRAGFSFRGADSP